MQSIIDFAENYLLSAGVPSADLEEGSENPLAVQAIIIQAKMAINTDPTEMRINPFLVSIIEQLRMAPQAEESEESEDTPSDTEQTDDPIIIDPVLDGDDNENQG